MGMFTELVMAAQIKDDPEVISILEFMLDNNSTIEDNRGGWDVNNLPDHPLFSTPRWECMLTADSPWFPGKSNSELRFEPNYYDGYNYYLSIRCNIKDYDLELELFLDWLSPYIVPEGFMGYLMYEDSKYPELIFITEEHKLEILDIENEFTNNKEDSENG